MDLIHSHAPGHVHTQAHAPAAHIATPPPHALDHPALELAKGRAFAATHGGLLPVDPFWRYMEYRHDLNPTRFDHNHRGLAPLLDRDAAARAALGQVPADPTEAYLTYRHDLNPARFDHFHPRIGRRIEAAEGAFLPPVPTVPATPAAGVSSVETAGGGVAAVPAPAGVILLALGLTLTWALGRWARRGAAGLGRVIC